jgi:hypothetical protein
VLTLHFFFFFFFFKLSFVSQRSYAVAASSVEGLPIFAKLSAIVPREQAKIKALKATHGEVQIGTCTVDQVS